MKSLFDTINVSSNRPVKKPILCRYFKDFMYYFYKYKKTQKSNSNGDIRDRDMAYVPNRMSKDRSVVDGRAFSSLHFTFKDTDFGIVMYLSIHLNNKLLELS